MLSCLRYLGNHRLLLFPLLFLLPLREYTAIRFHADSDMTTDDEESKMKIARTFLSPCFRVEVDHHVDEDVEPHEGTEDVEKSVGAGQLRLLQSER